MTERLLPTLPASTLPAIPESSTLPGNIDQSLLQSALARWQTSQEGLQALFANAPMNDGANTYWAARAPGTPLSRRDRANQLYRGHIEATAQVAFALGTLNAEQLKPLWLVLDSGPQAMRLDDQPIHCEHLALKLSDNSIRKLPAAWVISVGNQQPVAQLLYLPTRPVPVQAFKDRSDMEHWLSTQLLAPPELPSHFRFEYTTRTGPLTTGIAQLFSPALQARPTEVFAQAPSLEDLELTEGFGDVDQSSLFDSLAADIPLALRQASLGRQRAALETLLGEDLDSDRQKALDDTLKALETAELAADTAASTLLYRSRTLDLETFNRAFNALYQAHKDGLKAEVELQRTLTQLDSTELELLKVLLDPPDADDHDPDVAFASLLLSMRTDTGAPLRQELNGVFVIARQQALSDPGSADSLLLYWPGIGGGLQRFADRKDLEQQLLKIQGQNPVLILQLQAITTDPLLYSLNQQTRLFEEQAAQIRQRYPDDTLASQRAQELEKLRRQTLALLQVPVNPARSLALMHLQEQRLSASMVGRLPTWLGTLAAPDGARLKSLTSTYIQAMQRSHEQLQTTLVPRDVFTRRHLQAQLREDFSLKGDFDVQLDLPDSVTLQKQLSDGAAPGTPQKLVAVPSTARSKMSLEELAQLNIDNSPSMQLEPLSLRLGFMRVEVTTADDRERQALTAGITPAYLRKTLPQLDLPKAYEKLIYDTFMGDRSEPLFVREHRRECLIEPWRLTLQLQGECARLQGQIGLDDLQALNTAIDADNPQAWQAGGKRIEILPAYLSAGGKDTPNEGPVTLSGVTFIQEQVSGMTLLYLPDTPDGQPLRRYDSLEEARRALFNLCLRSEMVSYLAGRALQGDVRAHESRINQAVLKHFDAMIGVGVRWPAATSLAAHLLNTQMGRLIESHRGTSRSNDALFLERCALSGPKTLNYIKMAMGLVPFVGAAIALHDAWTSANRAVAALLRADVGEGLTEIESVLLSVIDAAMDILPGAAASKSATGARALTRARQLQALGKGAMALPPTSKYRARHIAERFAGYEYEKPISLLGLQPVEHGVYRNIYRHADGDFITRQGRLYQVEPSTDSRGWRLSGTHKKTYKQPIALDEAGRWDTWFGVYGATFEGGGLGGGGVLGHLADTLDPIWPVAIRERLPRWWGDRVFRHQQALTEAADNFAPQLNARPSAPARPWKRTTTAPSKPVRRCYRPPKQPASATSNWPARSIRRWPNWHH
ncbi:dermonecrotic toxin domain-containing protein [Pseudomonas sp. NPDC087336]|uniref:dermonecrotic toxin domain-containing protein n=1 Tax=Pseudomonas sp. NPDC087336 TaxID=3364436 RepID=UPI00381ED50F